MNKKNILIIEDSKDVIDLIKLYLPEHYILYSDLSGEEGLSIYNEVKPDLLILDLMLPVKSGYEVLKEIRKESRIPVIILSAKDLEHEIILGLNKGADDYLTKPFRPLELVARVEALLRRVGDLNCNLIKIGNIEIDIDGCIVKKEDKAIEFTAKEYEILKFFMLNPNKVYTKNQILKEIWGDINYDEQIVPVYVGRIREKIEDNPKKPEKIVNIRGLGYKFDGK